MPHFALGWGDAGVNELWLLILIMAVAIRRIPPRGDDED